MSLEEEDDLVAPARGEVKPPISRREGHVRRVGVEVELGGVTVEACAIAVAEHFGGTIQRRHEYEFDVICEEGTFRVELDSLPLKAIAEERGGRAIEASALQDLGERMMLGMAEPFVPVEIVTPPLLVTSFERLDSLITSLRSKGAKGTSDRIFYAFGVHFNPEVPSTSVESILSHLRSFLLLRDWIRRESDIDLARRMTPHIEPHPKALSDRVLHPGYSPDITKLIDDYLAICPSRSHDLDMLPLFAHLDPDRVNAICREQKINPRPTYHYRLPNSQIGDPDWRLSDEWRSWLLVERLAHDEERLHHWMNAWVEHNHDLFAELFHPWADEVAERIHL